MTPHPAASAEDLAAPGGGIAGWSWLVGVGSLAVAGVLILPSVRIPWQAHGSRWAYILVTAALLAFGLTPLVIRLARAGEIFDFPSVRKVHALPTPLLGGLAIYLAFGVSILANSILDRQVTAILAGASLLVVTGVVDDARGVPAGVKLAIQVAAVGVVMHAGVTLTFFGRSTLGDLLNGLLTILWLLGITNAMNFFDGMDGLATGLSIITAGFLGVFAVMTHQPFLGWFAAAIVGACLGFLPFNFRPHKAAAIFLGDAGSTFLGFVLAALAVKGDWAENDLIDICAPVLIFWVFIFDMTHITVSRLLSGKVRTFHEWIAYVGRDHLHHRLETLLGSKRKTVVLIFFISISMGLGAMALVNAHTFEALLLILQAIVVVSVVTILEYAGNRL